VGHLRRRRAQQRYERAVLTIAATGAAQGGCRFAPEGHALRVDA
jgi:hypothetical protein